MTNQDENEYMAKKLRRIKDNKCFNSETGFTILELLVSLSILSLLTVTLLSNGFTSKDPFSDAACEAECEKILYTLLQHQNEAIMDGYQRQVRFGKTAMQVIWTKAGVNHRDYIPVETLTFTGDYTGAAALTLHQHGTVSQGGTVYLNGYNGVVRKIVVQVGNGRIYLDEP